MLTIDVKINNVVPFLNTNLCLSCYIITEHHKIQMLDFIKPFQVQSQLNTSSVNENLLPQEASKPSQVIPESNLALYFKHKSLQNIVQMSHYILTNFYHLYSRFEVMWVLQADQNPSDAKVAGFHLSRHRGLQGLKNTFL